MSSISKTLESPPFLPRKGIKIEQFNDILRSKKDTKIYIDAFDTHIQPTWVTIYDSF